jgi:hypothetical protein
VAAPAPEPVHEPAARPPCGRPIPQQPRRERAPALASL